MSQPMSGAATHIAEAAVKTTSPAVNNRRAPRRSPRPPARSSKLANGNVYPSTTQERPAASVCRSARMLGRATLPAVTSSNAMPRPKLLAMRVNRGSGCGRGMHASARVRRDRCMRCSEGGLARACKPCNSAWHGGLGRGALLPRAGARENPGARRAQAAGRLHDGGPAGLRLRARARREALRADPRRVRAHRRGREHPRRRGANGAVRPRRRAAGARR